MCRRFDSVLSHTFLNKYGDCGEVVNASDCGSDIRGFDSHQSPHIYIIYLSGCSLVVKPQPSKLMLSVRFRSPAPLLFHSSSVVELSAVNRSVVGSSPTCGAIRPLGQAVKTPPFHGGNTGSNPVGVI